MTDAHLRHVFVTSAPTLLEPGMLYVSIEYATTLHLCCCGCSREVVLPLSPTGWSVTYDGATVSMSPSVGNWSFPCRSHYWIDHDCVRWAAAWRDEQVAEGRERTLQERTAVSDTCSETLPSRRQPRLLRAARRLIGGRRS